jgi:hypothetical protein
MPLLPIKGYQVAHRVGGNSDITLILEGGTVETFRSVSTTESLYLTNLLRFEKPVWLDSETKQVKTGVEPIGEMETK